MKYMEFTRRDIVFTECKRFSAMDEKYAQKISDIIAAKAEHACPHCDRNDWGLNTRMVSLPLVETRTDHPTSYVMPCFSLECSNCGYVKLFAANTVDPD